MSSVYGLSASNTEIGGSILGSGGGVLASFAARRNASGVSILSLYAEDASAAGSAATAAVAQQAATASKKMFCVLRILRILAPIKGAMEFTGFNPPPFNRWKGGGVHHGWFLFFGRSCAMLAPAMNMIAPQILAYYASH
jgi:hypothetical protein